MQFSTAFIVAALPFLISASPTQRQAKAERRSDYPKLAARGIFDAAKPPPVGCSFLNARAGGNDYIEDPTGNGDSCFGYPSRETFRCKGPYEQKEIDDIKKAVKEQATKDGHTESSSAGEWTATFDVITSAMKDRDTSVFDTTLDSVNVEDNFGAGQKTYFWYLKGGTIAVHRSSCPGDII
ncbi:MAG: hypothetical protein Q9169_007088 [Polycauliona sp. 2 TL-2023]